MTYQDYQTHRRWWEVSMWLAGYLLNWLANVEVIWLEMARRGSTIARWEPAVWEGSSAISSLLLILFILAVDRYWRLTRERWRGPLLVHLVCTVPFSILHVMIMVGLREAAYAWQGGNYDFGHWPSELFYEYLKDFRSYLSCLTIIYLYRFILRRWQGEAEFLSEGREESAPEPVVDRFLVKKLGREFLVKVRDIDWIESAGNYINLHVGERVYPLRETMTAIESRLSEQGFFRVHRSNIVNLERVAELIPLDSGDAYLRLSDQQQIAVSRRYRKHLRERLEQGAVDNNSV